MDVCEGSLSSEINLDGREFVQLGEMWVDANDEL